MKDVTRLFLQTRIVGELVIAKMVNPQLLHRSASAKSQHAKRSTVNVSKPGYHAQKSVSVKTVLMENVKIAAI